MAGHGSICSCPETERRACCSRAVQWLNWKHGAPCNAFQTPATRACNSSWPPTSEPVPGRHSCGHPAGETSQLHDHSSLPPLWASLHLPLIPPCFPPAKWLHPAIPVCSDCIFFPSLWNKLRTVLCSFPTFLPCFATLLQEARRML